MHSWSSRAIVLSLLLIFSLSLSTQAARQQPPPAHPQKPSSASPGHWVAAHPDYFGIKMLSTSSGWVVGAAGTIRRYDGSKWNDYLSPVTNTLRSVDGTATEGWIVGDGVLLRWAAGSLWQPLDLASFGVAGANLSAVEITQPGEAWATGSILSSTLLLHYQQGRWQRVTTPHGEGGPVMDWIIAPLKPGSRAA